MKYLLMIVFTGLLACKENAKAPTSHKRWIGDVYLDQNSRKLVILVADKPGSEQKARTYTVDIAEAIQQSSKDSIDFSQLTFPCDKGDFIYYTDSTGEAETDSTTR